MFDSNQDQRMDVDTFRTTVGALALPVRYTIADFQPRNIEDWDAPCYYVYFQVMDSGEVRIRSRIYGAHDKLRDDDAIYNAH